MKNRLTKILLVLALFLFSACQPDPTPFNEALLVGKWVKGTEYWRYDADHNGATWDVADDVSEAEAQSFTWELTDNQLTQYHKMESSSAVVPKTYTVVTLDQSLLQYEDLYGNLLTFTKQL